MTQAVTQYIKDFLSSHEKKKENNKPFASVA